MLLFSLFGQHWHQALTNDRLVPLGKCDLTTLVFSVHGISINDGNVMTVILVSLWYLLACKPMILVVLILAHVAGTITDNSILHFVKFSLHFYIFEIPEPDFSISINTRFLDEFLALNHNGKLLFIYLTLYHSQVLRDAKCPAFCGTVSHLMVVSCSPACKTSYHAKQEHA